MGSKKPGQPTCGPGQRKRLQSTDYRLLSGVPGDAGKLLCTSALLQFVSPAPAGSALATSQLLLETIARVTGLRQLPLLLLGHRLFSLNLMNGKSKKPFGFCHRGAKATFSPSFCRGLLLVRSDRQCCWRTAVSQLGSRLAFSYFMAVGSLGFHTRTLTRCSPLLFDRKQKITKTALQL